MREILFRGKRKDNGEWIYGDLLQRRDLGEYLIEYFDYYIDKNGLRRDYYCQYQIIPETVGQYTGLNDMTDKNGCRIFEGDIVEGLGFDGENGYGVIKWEDGAFWVESNHFCGTFCKNYNGYDFEVIGNIHDNPELLKGGESDA